MEFCSFFLILGTLGRPPPRVLVLAPLGIITILILLLLVDLDQPVLLHHALLLAVDAAVPVEAPGLLPLAGLLVEVLGAHAALLARLGLDAALGGELLPLGGGLGLGQRLLARQGGARGRQGEEDAFGRRGDGTGRQELVY